MSVGIRYNYETNIIKANNCSTDFVESDFDPMSKTMHETELFLPLI